MFVCYSGQMATATALETASPGSASAPVGDRVKALREGLGLSLRGLSERSGVSPTMLSQVERGETSPTLTVAERIAQGLGLTLSQLLRLDESPHVVVGREGEYRSHSSGGHSVEVITPPLPGLPSEVSRHRLAPGARTGRPDEAPLHEPGSRETAFVLVGQLTFRLAGEELLLGPGDSVTFDADIDHHFENEDDGACEFIAVVSAGRRSG
jgi:transcriptional regulator with XRE-family HTH domain